jgi:glycosyltransferase involved in cell wall biosynthesis
VLFWFLGTLAFARRLHPLALWRGLTAPDARPVDSSGLDRLRPTIVTSDSRSPSVHVVLPTLGRPHCVADMLDDLAAQSIRPRSVAIVEQITDLSGASDLATVVQRAWPFDIRHHVVHWVGACRARNLGMTASDADWTLLFDDDVRLPQDFIRYMTSVAEGYGVDVVTAFVAEPGTDTQADARKAPALASSLAGGACLVARPRLETVGGFDERLEHGWGEDTDFGIRLRRGGATILRAPGEPVVHLRAAVGGFRFVRRLPWDDDTVKPRPAPTVLLARRGLPVPQQRGYRLYYVLKRLSAAHPARVVTEVPRVVSEWRSASMWAERFARGPARSTPAARL